MTGQQLVEALPAAQAGEPWALRVVYEELAPQVLGYLRRRGAGEPEDLVSEVFLALFPRLPGVTGGVPGLRTLTFSIAHARLVDDVRRRARRPPARPYDTADDQRTSPSSEDVALARLDDDQVATVLAALPDDQRDVLLMRVVGDLSVDQVAAVLGRSAGAVKQLQRRGLLGLRAALGTGELLGVDALAQAGLEAPAGPAAGRGPDASTGPSPTTAGADRRRPADPDIAESTAVRPPRVTQQAPRTMTGAT